MPSGSSVFLIAVSPGVLNEEAELFSCVACSFEERCTFGVVLLEALSVVSPKTRLMDTASHGR